MFRTSAELHGWLFRQTGQTGQRCSRSKITTDAEIISCVLRFLGLFKVLPRAIGMHDSNAEAWFVTPFFKRDLEKIAKLL